MDDKYITFKREDFFQMMGELALPPWRDNQGQLLGGDIDCAPLAAVIKDRAESTEIQDAVVIRRQDYYASPALAGYAASIAISVKTTDDPKLRAQLTAVSDYFQRQSEMAADEGFKLPDV